jgi:hypothetical protein
VGLKPSIQALLLADDVSEDPVTRKLTVTGIFDVIEVQRPATHFTAPAYLFLALKDVLGQIEVVVHYVDLRDHRVLVQYTRLIAQHHDRLATAVTALRLCAGIPVPHPGVYAFELHTGNELLGSIRVEAVVLNEDGQPRDGKDVTS